MIDIGLDSDSAHEYLQRQMDIIKVIDDLDEQLSSDPRTLAEPGSELAALAEDTRNTPVDLLFSVRAGLTAARDSLDQIAYIFSHNLPTSPIVLQALTRSALMGAGRVVFALSPTDPVQRRQNARLVLRQEGQSLLRGLNAFSHFTHLSSLKPDDGYLAVQRERNAMIQEGQRPSGEARILEEMASVIGAQLVASTLSPPDGGEPVAEHITWLWHTFSGAAHGFGWPKLLPGTPSMPGNYVADLGLVVSISHLAFDTTVQRTRVAS